MQLRISVLAALLLLVSTCLAEAQTKEVLLSEVPEGLEVATVAGGCFWCTEAVFERVKGVADVFSGYSGGAEEGPTYRKVSNGMSTHAEAIQIYFDPRVLNFDKLLEIFFTVAHDPTQIDRQGPDVGTQYRSGVYYHNERQKASIDKLLTKYKKEGKFSKPIVTEIKAFDRFWLAEDYHQDYYELNGGNPYIRYNAVPKVQKLKKKYPTKIKAKYVNER